jgi:hypothetical protein
MVSGNGIFGWAAGWLGPRGRIPPDPPSKPWDWKKCKGPLRAEAKDRHELTFLSAIGVGPIMERYPSYREVGVQSRISNRISRASFIILGHIRFGGGHPT